jgi:uncharacterized protein with GYD domain
MPKYVTLASWSAASWARMINTPDDRVAAARELADALGTTLEAFYWLPLAAHDVLIMFDAPDSVTASAVNMAVGSTGAVRNIETYELLTHEQLSEALALATDVRQIYRPPGEHRLSPRPGLYQTEPQPCAMDQAGDVDPAHMSPAPLGVKDLPLLREVFGFFESRPCAASAETVADKEPASACAAQPVVHLGRPEPGPLSTPAVDRDVHGASMPVY